MGREQPRERGYEVDAAVVGDLAGERLALRGARDDPELVAQPVHGRAGYRDGAFQGVHRFAFAELVADRGEQPVPGTNDVVTGVEQDEVARAIGVLARGMETTLQMPGRLEQSRLDHKRILDAIVAGDPAAARRAARAHIRGARAAAFSRLRAEQPQPGSDAG